MQTKSFQDLIVWQKAHQLAVSVYKLTQTYPKSEIYSLVSQIRRSSISIPSNIAEGYGRRGSKEKRQFYIVAQSSIYELESQVLLSRDVGYISQNQCQQILNQSQEVSKILNIFINKF